MRRPDVDRMMASMTAREYKEWEAYERAVGSLDAGYEREILAEIHELLQFGNLLTGASMTKRGKKNPAGKFRRVARPDEMYDPPDPDEPDEDDEEFDEDDVDPYDDEEEEYETAPSNGYDPSKDPFANM
jgi:hypothetical protein